MMTERKEQPFPRHSYEGAGGWNDGRLGQAYDLISDVLNECGDQYHRKTLCSLIEEIDLTLATKEPST